MRHGRPATGQAKGERNVEIECESQASARAVPGLASDEALCAGEADEILAGARAGARGVAASLDVQRRGSLDADAALGVASGHARTAVAALAGAESAIARGEGLVATLARLARQTQRTALNASIEAARAGEEGLAFGAVAESLRRLAAEAAGAARTAAAEMAEVRAEAERASRASQAAAEGVDGARGAVRELAGEMAALWEEAEAVADALHFPTQKD